VQEEICVDTVQLWHWGAGFIFLSILLMLFWAFYRAFKSAKDLQSLQNRLQEKAIEIATLNQAFESTQEELSHARISLDKMMQEYKNINEELHQARLKEARLNAKLEEQNHNYAKLEASFKEQGKQLELKLNEIMQERLDEKLKKFDENSMKSLHFLLKPFGENLESFKRKIESSQEENAKRFAQLSKEIEFVAKAGLNISQEAQNLTNALKGKKQTQGSWGEMILESVLEYSGLLKGVHYELQSSYRDEDGRLKRPDVIIKLPAKRSIIIDSKVSLNDYDAYIRAQDDASKEFAAKNLVQAFKKHIDTLDAKDYAHYEAGTLQHIFMFVPIEGAFALALQKEPSLYEYALKKYIAIVTPSTLTVSLRTIYLYWQSEQSTFRARALFNEAGKLYDKMVNFAQTYNRFGGQLQTLLNTYELGQKQLAKGQGNILKRVQKLQHLGAKTTKQLDTNSFESEDFDNLVNEVALKDDKALK
jgi:DNA recombination protein RmuC